MKNLIHDNITSDLINKIDYQVKRSASIIITSHISPDDDSISSTLAVYIYLIKYLKVNANVKMIYTGDRLDRWENIPLFNKIDFVDDVSDHVGDVDTLIFLDGSDWKRFSWKNKNPKFNGKIICIDHHMNPEEIFDIHLVAKHLTSTAETVYRLFYHDKSLTKEICEILLMGILGDTGNFRFVEPHQSGVFDVAKRLVEEGMIKLESLQSKYDSIPLEIESIIGELIRNIKPMKIVGWPDFVYTYLHNDYQKNNKLKDSEIEFARLTFSETLKNIKSYSWGFTVTPMKNGSKLSARSLPNSVSVRLMMENLKIGGGHNRSAGGLLKIEDTSNAVNFVLNWMKNNKPHIV